MSKGKFVNESHDLNEIEMKIFKVLLERFGEPIGKSRDVTVGIADEGPGGKHTYADDAIEHNWSDEGVVKECDCDENDEMDEVSPPGWEGTVKAMKKHSDKIDNPWALSYYMKSQGAKSHYKKSGKKKKSEATKDHKIPLVKETKYDLQFSDEEMGHPKLGFLKRVGFKAEAEDLNYEKFLRAKGINARVVDGVVYVKD